mgnify:CR=1 FL=1|tara:strand:+ start:357 stop:716 length:360 start_codon:yes stop_codon:yes gene_type:complete
MKKIKLSESEVTRVIKRVINEQEEGVEVELTDDDARDSAYKIVDGYAGTNIEGVRVTEKGQLNELYYMYKHMLMDAIYDNGGKLTERDYNNAVEMSKRKHGNTSPVIPYESLIELAKYI